MHTTVTNTSDVSLEPPHLRCLPHTHFNLIITILKLTAFHTSPAPLQAVGASLSSIIPIPSFLTAFSPTTGSGLPGCKKVDPPTAGQTSAPNHLVSCTQATDTPFVVSLHTELRNIRRVQERTCTRSTGMNAEYGECTRITGLYKLVRGVQAFYEL